MTEAEIIAVFKKGEELLERYRQVMAPAAAELARLKSLYVFGEEGKYDGRFGCFEDGIETVCLHITSDAMGKVLSELMEKVQDKSFDFELEWRKKLRDGGVGEQIYLSGHY